MWGRDLSPFDYYWKQELLQDEGRNISTEGSCSNVNHFSDWADKCYFVQNNDNCQDVDGFINYVSVIYCTAGHSLFPLTVILYILWLVVLFISLAVAADDYFCPAIEIISKTLRLSQNIAGVTIMALGNGAPDIFSALAGIGQGRPELVFGSLFGAGVFVTTCVAGAVSIAQPFKLMERPFLRDVTFYLVAGFWAFYIFWSKEVRLLDSLGFLGLYLAYILVVLVGRFIHNRNRVDLPYAAQEDEGAEGSGPAHDQGNQASRPIVMGDPPEIQLVPECRNCTSVKDNLRLMLWSLNPISGEWSEANLIFKVYYVFKAPIDVLFKLTNPVVDREAENDGWCQYQAVIQTFLGPLFAVFASATALDTIAGSVQVWELTLNASLLLAVIVALTSRSRPPPYHTAFAFAGFVIAIVWIYAIANELVSLLKAFGVMFGLTDAILGLTVLAWGNSIGDMIADVAMAKRGSPRMGFSAAFGGPLFNMLLGIGLPFTIQILGSGGKNIGLEFDSMTAVLAIGLAVSLVFSYVLLPILGFKATKLYGAALLLIYLVFLITCIVIEFTVME